MPHKTKDSENEETTSLVLGLVVLGLGLGLVDNKYITLFIIFYFIGVILGGFIGYQQSQSANAIATIPPSTYQGIVQAIYTNNPSSITFTSGSKWQGNISRVSNLTIGAVCTLIQNDSREWAFISGTCMR